ncbi:flagellar export protein FliJ [Candidatus Aerophobetes bacterium]|nr:flagellar export protein FliJ [Candidatus Aerophobetes bacterium]
MKKFYFSLDFLLNYKKTLEDKLKVELTKLIRKQKKEEKVLKELEEKRDLYQEEVRKREREEKMDLGLIIAYDSYLGKVNSQIEEQKDKLYRILKEKENIRKKIVDVSRQRKLLERLKEKKWLEFIFLREKSNQQVIDESALLRFYKKSKAKDNLL